MSRARFSNGSGNGAEIEGRRVHQKANNVEGLLFDAFEAGATAKNGVGNGASGSALAHANAGVDNLGEGVEGL
ncbi:hypothetical protein HDV00_005991 [Rhizophlyctis rosea]|nr:hypothetical protein HDV00_005991 [Rhizophlyctis rosea]